MQFPERLYQPGPKRLLALDGGGIRGVITLGYLKRIEAILRERRGEPKLVLADYFDLIGGTSTGALIATLLSLGRSVGEIENMYLSLGKNAFRRRRLRFGPLDALLRSRFDDAPLAQMLRDELGDRTLAAKDFRSGLMVVAKRADTASVWPLVNIPTQKYFEFNKSISLWEILRASTAAPTFFRSHRIADVGAGEDAVFVDGAISMHNSPALLLLMVATMKGFGLSWKMGENDILLCSVGTGAVPTRGDRKRLAADSNLAVLPVVMRQLLSDAAELNTTILQWISRSPTAELIDTQIGDLAEDMLGPEPLLSYLRYEIPLVDAHLEKLGLRYSKADLAAIQSIAEPATIPHLQRIGERASEQVKPEHFSAAFDDGSALKQEAR